MTRVKICGITSESDIEILNEYQPDYAGFVFAISKRQLSPEAAGRLAGKLASSVRRVGVFVNAAREDLLEAVDAARLDIVQLHGDETPEDINRLRRSLKSGVEIWKAVRVRDAGSLKKIDRFAADRYLLDAYVDGSYGGMGKSFNWDWAGSIGTKACIILAGGLNPANVAEGIRRVKPYAVDVSSGVETGGGKDGSKVRDFMNAVKETQARTRSGKPQDMEAEYERK